MSNDERIARFTKRLNVHFSIAPGWDGYARIYLGELYVGRMFIDAHRASVAAELRQFVNESQALLDILYHELSERVANGEARIIDVVQQIEQPDGIHASDARTPGMVDTGEQTITIRLLQTPHDPPDLVREDTLDLLHELVDDIRAIRSVSATTAQEGLRLAERLDKFVEDIRRQDDPDYWEHEREYDDESE